MGRKPSPTAEAMWRDRLTRFRVCGLTVKEYCRQEGVSDPSFYQWRQRLDMVPKGSKRVRRSGNRTRKTVKSQPFVAVKVSSSEGVPNSGLAEVELPSGVRIRVPVTRAEALRVAILTGNEACREVR